MIVYNVTVKVDSTIAAEWLLWLHETYAPAMLATGCFWKYHVLHLLELDDAEGSTYAIQYYAHTTDDYHTYTTNFAHELQQKAVKKWGERFVSFGTLMKVLA